MCTSHPRPSQAAEKRRKQKERRTGISWRGTSSSKSADFDSDFPDEARRAREAEGRTRPRAPPPVCREAHFAPWTLGNDSSATTATTTTTPMQPSWLATVGAWLGLAPAASRHLSETRLVRSSFFPSFGGAQEQPRYIPDPAHPSSSSSSSSYAAVPAWLIGHRQTIERAVLRAAGVPLLRVHDLTLAVPCAGLGTIGYPDCTHYCLPGVPDAWTQLLHAFVTNTPFFNPAFARAARSSKATTPSAATATAAVATTPVYADTPLIKP